MPDWNRLRLDEGIIKRIDCNIYCITIPHPNPYPYPYPGLVNLTKSKGMKRIVFINGRYKFNATHAWMNEWTKSE